VSHHSDAIDDRIADAREEASHTCEVCGELGKQLEVEGWIRAVCDKHAHIVSDA
jgi:hypothetical protein